MNPPEMNFFIPGVSLVQNLLIYTIKKAASTRAQNS